MTGHDTVARGLATAMVSGPWTRRDLVLRSRAALGRRRSPTWLSQLVGDVVDAYRDPPSDRPRELAAFLTTRPAWATAWQQRTAPRIVQLAPVRTEHDLRPWPTTLVRDHAGLAALLDVDQGELAWFADVRGLTRAAGAPLQHYRWTSLPRPGGRVRLVAAPKPRLKEIQRRVLRHLLASIPRHPAAHGAMRGTSVRTAVTPHAGRSVVIRADLRSFFPSVPAGRVWGLLRTAGLDEDLAHTVTGLVTTVVPPAVLRSVPQDALDAVERARLRRPHLPTGAPTSPALADLVAFTLDRRLTGLADRFGARYTRYVDDLVFSGGPALRGGRARFVAAVDEVVRAEGFALNERKTVVLNSSGRQAALGAVVNARPGVARPERDLLRAIVHNCATHGWRSQARGDEDFPARLLGRISWVASLNPAQGARLRAAYDAVEWT